MHVFATCQGCATVVVSVQPEEAVHELKGRVISLAGCRLDAGDTVRRLWPATADTVKANAPVLQQGLLCCSRNNPTQALPSPFLHALCTCTLATLSCLLACSVTETCCAAWPFKNYLTVWCLLCSGSAVRGDPAATKVQSNKRVWPKAAPCCCTPGCEEVVAMAAPLVLSLVQAT